MRIVLALVVLLFSILLQGENLVRSNTSPSDEIVRERPQPITARQMLQNSATIFAGTVLAVEHSSHPSDGEGGITRIRFRVQNAIRGVRPGQVIEVREWGALWNTGERYSRGENVVLFLYPASKLGLTSPVAGAAGRFRVDKTWRVQVANGNPLPRPLAPRKKLLTVREFAAAIRREAKE
jgi:hypothetical protein